MASGSVKISKHIDYSQRVNIKSAYTSSSGWTAPKDGIVILTLITMDGYGLQHGTQINGVQVYQASSGGVTGVRYHDCITLLVSKGDIVKCTNTYGMSSSTTYYFYPYI